MPSTRNSGVTNRVMCLSHSAVGMAFIRIARNLLRTNSNGSRRIWQEYEPPNLRSVLILILAQIEPIAQSISLSMSGAIKVPSATNALRAIGAMSPIKELGHGIAMGRLDENTNTRKITKVGNHPTWKFPKTFIKIIK